MMTFWSNMCLTVTRRVYDNILITSCTRCATVKHMFDQYVIIWSFTQCYYLICTAQLMDAHFEGVVPLKLRNHIIILHATPCHNMTKYYSIRQQDGCMMTFWSNMCLTVTRRVHDDILIKHVFNSNTTGVW
jgi:hypothetical protein